VPLLCSRYYAGVSRVPCQDSVCLNGCLTVGLLLCPSMNSDYCPPRPQVTPNQWQPSLRVGAKQTVVGQLPSELPPASESHEPTEGMIPLTANHTVLTGRYQQSCSGCQLFVKMMDA
jgi:hypothetical protein